MSEIKKLIERLCPDGVEYKPLWQLTAWDKKFNGVDKSMQKKIIKYPYVLAKVFDDLEVDEGDVRLLSTGISDKERWTTEEIAGDLVCDGEIVAIPWGGTPNVKYYKGKFVTADNRIATSLDKNILNNKFLFYYLNNIIEDIAALYRGAGIQHPSMKGVLSLEIPVPPIEVQSKIAEILDNFTELEAELEAQLEAELEARKKQYEYYRNQLLTFNKVGGARFDVKWMKMSDIGTFTRGKRFVRTDIVEDGVPCIHYGDMYTYYGLKAYKAKTHLTPEKAQKMRFAKKNDVVIVGAGENKNDIGVGVAWLGEEDVAVHDACYIFSSDLYPQYVSHFLRTESYHKQIYPLVAEGKICSISAQSIGRAIIPIPPLEEQKRIVSILDRFEALTTDLQSGLPAEIEARRKQYEYYREKLLTFKRKTA